MNYRMNKTWGVLANVVWQDQILCNDFRICVEWTTATDDGRETNIAFDRLKYWLYDVMEHSVIVNQDHDKVPQLIATGQRVITIPGDPIDPVIGMMLFAKFTAMTEQRMIFSEVAVSSEQGGHVQHLQGADEDLMMFAGPGWWQDPGPSWQTTQSRRNNKVVNLERVPEWSELNLCWDANETKTNGHVVFAQFKKNAD